MEFSSPYPNKINWQSLSKHQRLQSLSQIESSAPPSYKSNTIKEELVLQYVRVFERQYVELFQERERLALVVRNEYGVKKFISTFIKPTLLPYAELYDSHAITQFLHNYLTYEPLPSPHQLPSIICSPTITLTHQKGDSFDLSILYCSLLRGAGYEAYVCIGRASGKVARAERLYCPEQIRDDDDDYIQYESFKDANGGTAASADDVGANGAAAQQQNDGTASVATATTKKKSKYSLKKRMRLESEFDQMQKDKEDQVAGENGQNEQNTDDSSDQYIHAWILVLPNARSMAPPTPHPPGVPITTNPTSTPHVPLPADQPYFIETSTGEQKPITDTDYKQIEAVFNHQNYWVNMQENVPVAQTDFDLYNLDNWEYIFVSEGSDDENEGLGASLKQPTENDDGNGAPTAADTVESGEHDTQVLDLPTSWVGRITLTKEQFFSKYPGKNKRIQYMDATIQLYTPYSRDDCLTKSITYFDKDAPSKKLSEHLFYENREDKLIRRSLYNASVSVDDTSPPVQRSVKHEWFAPGRRKGSSIEALKEVIQVKSEKNEYRFYWDARLDGLEKRIELFHPSTSFYPRKIVLTFRGRTDFLSYRSVTYDMNTQNTASGNEHPTFKSMEERSVLKMSEKFERDSSKIADEDVAKRTFYLNEGRMRLLYHYGPDKITHAVREYTKRGDMSIDIVDPFQARPKLSDAISEYKELLNAEKNCEANIRSANVEMKSILETRQKDEQNVKYVTTIYDTLLNQPTPEEIEELKRKERERLEKLKRKDVLGSLYPKEGIKSEEQAREIFKKCLRNMRKRLLERAKILEARLTHERNQINRRRTAYQKTQEGSERNEEEFVKFWEDTMFRMGIIRKRVERNKIESKKEYAQLQEELLNDDRLAPFLQRERKKFFSQKESLETDSMHSPSRLAVSTRR
uniref:Dynein regulatory complex subunit 7 n=1 Tax=Percolomonas cosmopolitus TaxID=63605 RepID=A0A7S1KU27_9EUKA